ncbi:hypothetical protein AOLI_G00003610 [Acnodon oligacanthus]
MSPSTHTEPLRDQLSQLKVTMQELRRNIDNMLQDRDSLSRGLAECKENTKRELADLKEEIKRQLVSLRQKIHHRDNIIEILKAQLQPQTVLQNTAHTKHTQLSPSQTDPAPSNTKPANTQMMPATKRPPSNSLSLTHSCPPQTGKETINTKLPSLKPKTLRSAGEDKNYASTTWLNQFSAPYQSDLHNVPHNAEQHFITQQGHQHIRTSQTAEVATPDYSEHRNTAHSSTSAMLMPSEEHLPLKIWGERDLGDRNTWQGGKLTLRQC